MSGEPRELSIEEAKAKELLSRMARAVGLKLLEMPKDAWHQKHWCFSDGKTRFIGNFYSLQDMLKTVLELEEFIKYPWNIEGEPWEKTLYLNPFCELSVEELNVKLDLMGV